MIRITRQRRVRRIRSECIGCDYRRDHGGDCPQYRCEHCHRWVPWCQGASDDYPETCDECVMTVKGLYK